MLTSQDVRCQKRQINPATDLRCVPCVSTAFNLSVKLAVAKTAGWCLSSSDPQITATQEEKKTLVNSVIQSIIETDGQLTLVSPGDSVPGGRQL